MINAILISVLAFSEGHEVIGWCGVGSAVLSVVFCCLAFGFKVATACSR